MPKESISMLWDSITMLWDSNPMVWDSITMLWDYNAILWYGVCCQRYAYTDTYINSVYWMAY